MTDDASDFREVQRCLRAGEFTRARELIAPALEEARSAVTNRTRALVELLLIYETAVAEAAAGPSAKSLDALSLCEEAIALCEAARLDAGLLVTALRRAATRCLREDPRRSIKFSRRAIAVALEHSPPDVDIAWLRMNLVTELLASEDFNGALAEMESWTSWGVDDVEIWVIAETLFKASDSRTIPLLERLLRDRDSWDEAGRQALDRMLASARTWGP